MQTCHLASIDGTYPYRLWPVRPRRAFRAVSRHPLKRRSSMHTPSTARKASHKMRKRAPPIIMSHRAMIRRPSIARVAITASPRACCLVAAWRQLPLSRVSSHSTLMVRLCGWSISFMWAQRHIPCFDLRSQSTNWARRSRRGAATATPPGCVVSCVRVRGVGVCSMNSPCVSN